MLSRLRLTKRHIIDSPILKVKMSTFVLPHSNPEVSVHLTSELAQDQLLSFPAFKTWISTLQHSLATQSQRSHAFHEAPYKLRRIDVQHVDFFGEGRIGFLKLKAEVSNDSGEKLPGSVFLRGGSVGMMVGPANLFVRNSKLRLLPPTAHSTARRCCPRHRNRKTNHPYRSTPHPSRVSLPDRTPRRHA